MIGGPNKYETSCFVPLKQKMNTEKLVLNSQLVKGSS